MKNNGFICKKPKVVAAPDYGPLQGGRGGEGELELMTYLLSIAFASLKLNEKQS